MTITRLSWACLLTLGLTAAGLSGVIANRQMAIMTQTHMAVLRLDALRLLANVTATVNTERGLATLALQAPLGETSDIEKLTSSRLATDAAIAQAIGLAQAMDGEIGDARALLAGLDQIQTTWSQGRRFVDEKLHVTPAERGLRRC